MRWPFRRLFWRTIHLGVNRLAWYYAPLATDKHWLWRFNNWCARGYVQWMVSQYRAQAEAERLARKEKHEQRV